MTLYDPLITDKSQINSVKLSIQVDPYYTQSALSSLEHGTYR